jgi:Na+/H+ antiporter NhaD/arsenite permease-like protein
MVTVASIYLRFYSEVGVGTLLPTPIGSRYIFTDSDSESVHFYRLRLHSPAFKHNCLSQTLTTRSISTLISAIYVKFGFMQVTLATARSVLASATVSHVVFIGRVRSQTKRTTKHCISTKRRLQSDAPPLVAVSYTYATLTVAAYNCLFPLSIYIYIYTYTNTHTHTSDIS